MKRFLCSLHAILQTAYGRVGAAMILAFAILPMRAFAQLDKTKLEKTKGFLDSLQSTNVGPNDINVNPFKGIYDQISGATGQGGYEGLNILFQQIIQTGVTLITGIAVIFVIAAGMRMIFESNNEETAKKQSTTIFNILSGIVIMNIANFAIWKVSPDTNVQRIDSLLAKFDTIAGIKSTATGFATLVVFPLLDFALSFLAGVALLYIVYASLNIITHRGEEEKIKEARSRVLKTVLGLVVILLNKTFVSVFYGSFDNDLKPDLQLGINTAFSIANYALGFLGLVAVVALIYGGILIVTSGGEEKRRSQGLKILQYVLYGIILAMSAYTLTSGIVGITTRAS